MNALLLLVLSADLLLAFFEVDLQAEDLLFPENRSLVTSDKSGTTYYLLPIEFTGMPVLSRPFPQHLPISHLIRSY